MRLWNLLLRGVGLFAFALLAVSCGTEHAQVRFVHASPPNTPTLDVAVDGKTVVTALTFGTVSPASGYLSVSAGNRRIEMRDTGTTTDEIDSTISFGAGKAYTAIASGHQAAVAAVLLTDDPSAPTSGDSKLRVVHVAPDFPDVSSRVDVYIVPAGTNISGMPPTVASLAYGQASSYQSMAAASTEVIVTGSGTQATIIIDQTFPLSAGQNRTLVLLDDGGSPPVASFLELSDLN